MADLTDQYVDALIRAGVRARRVDEPWLGLVLVEGMGELTQRQCDSLLASIRAEREGAFNPSKG